MNILKVFVAVPLLSFLLLAPKSMAQTENMTSDGNWNNDANWSGLAGTIGDDVVFNNNTDAIVIIGDDINVNTLTFGSSATLIINNGGKLTTSDSIETGNNAEITVVGDLTINGNLVVNNNLILSVSGSLIINGNVVLKNNANLTFDPGSSTTISGDFSAGSNATIIVDAPVTIGGNVNIVGGNISGTGTMTVTGTCSGPLCGTGPLPVELLGFYAYILNGGVRLDWSTASEYNNDYFTIEKSKNGVDFEIAIQVAGAGMSNEILEYSELDEFPFTGISYYRLMQTDFDGTESYSSIVSVMNENSLGEVAFEIYPNPSKGGDHLDIMVRNLNTEESVKFNIVDLAGNTVYEQIAKANATGGLRTKFTIDRDLANGIYIVNVITEKSKINKKLLIK